MKIVSEIESGKALSKDVHKAAVSSGDAAKKEREITVIQGKIDSYEVENADLQRILESDDMSDYIARVAIEERGYAYSDERRFYDTSRD
jgi:hypothetical protein